MTEGNNEPGEYADPFHGLPGEAEPMPNNDADDEPTEINDDELDIEDEDEDY